MCSRRWGTAQPKRKIKMSATIKLAAWLTITALLFIAMHDTPLGVVFAFTVSSMTGFAALADHVENAATMGDQ